MTDMASKGRAAINSPLTDQQVKEIRSSSKPNVFFAALYGVHHTTISKIRHKHRWKSCR
jgi:hypothetical protein